MKILIFVALIISNHALAQTHGSEELYRPYLSCASTIGTTVIEVVQGVDKTAKPFQISIEKVTGSKVFKFVNLSSVRVPIKHKNILDLFEGATDKGDYRFELMVMRNETEEGHRAVLTDTHGTRGVYCSYHITGF